MGAPVGGWITAAAVAWATVASPGSPAPARARRVRPPVVVELYTAQGCDSCPDAQVLMKGLLDRPDVIPLTFSVDYWDYLGTKDSFAQPEFTARQRAYVDRLKVRDMYTPELVVNGRAEGAGEADKLTALIDRAERARAAETAPKITVLRRGVRIGPGSAGGRAADVWLVRYDPRPHRTRVKGDDGKTRSVMEYAVVRDLQRLGAWRGGSRDYAIPAATDGLKSVVLLQQPRGGHLVAAARVG